MLGTVYQVKTTEEVNTPNEDAFTLFIIEVQGQGAGLRLRAMNSERIVFDIALLSEVV